MPDMNVSVGYPGNVTRLAIEPCERCLDQTYIEGDAEGYERGHKDGHQAGHEEGYKDARNEFEEI